MGIKHECETIHPPPPRCKDTIDIEDFIAMQDKKEQPTKIKAIVTYKSGRTEEVHGKINKSGIADAKFSKAVSAAKAFPTVEKVQVEKY